MKNTWLPALLMSACSLSAAAQDSTGGNAYLKHLRARDSLRAAEVAKYLKAHPKTKKSYTDKRGYYVYIHHIDKCGKPVYWKTRKK